MTASPDDNPRHRFHPLVVREVIEETADARSLVFDVPHALSPLFHYRAGQFLTLEVTVGGARLRRCYSLSSAPETDSELKVTIKRVDGGRVSNHLNDRVRAGDILSVLPPDGRFTLGAYPGPLVFFAGGSGITPVISLVKAALASTRRPMLLLYANRNDRSVIFQSELQAIAARAGDRLRIGWWLDSTHGFVTGPQVQGLVSSEGAFEAYLCGPKAFMEVIENALLALKIDPARIHIETFYSLANPETEAAPAVAAPATPVTPAPPATPAMIEVFLDGKTRSIPSKPGKTILQSAFAAGMDPPHSCQEGVCGSCIAKLCEGEVDMHDTGVLSKADRQRNLIVTCQSTPKTPRVKVDYSAV